MHVTKTTTKPGARAVGGLAASVLALGTLAFTAPAASGEEARVAPLDTTIVIADVRSTDGVVTGEILNKTDDQLENVRLLVSDEFLWRNERHPGTDNPGNAYSVMVSGPIAPHGSAPFRFERPAPLPERSDGRFATDVSAIEVTRRPVGAAPTL
jgi:hypothetical protein